MKKITKNKKEYFQCEECGFLYGDKSWAVKCKQHCRKYHSCNIGITKHAIQTKKSGGGTNDR